MIEGMMMVSYSFGNGVIGEMLSRWEEAGFFSYILPFLLIFALIFGILTRIQIFKDNKAINGIIALAVGLMALQVDMVSEFFREVFPRLGVGLAILLVLLILAGLFIDPGRGGIMYTLLGIGTIIAIIVLVSSGGAVGWSSSTWWYNNWETIAGIIFFLAVLGIIVGSSTPPNPNPYAPLGWR